MKSSARFVGSAGAWYGIASAIRASASLANVSPICFAGESLFGNGPLIIGAGAARSPALMNASASVGSLPYRRRRRGCRGARRRCPAGAGTAETLLDQLGRVEFAAQVWRDHAACIGRL